MTGTEFPGTHMHADVMNLLERYCWTVDNRLWDDWLQCFQSDAVLLMGKDRLEGQQAILTYVKDSVGDYRMMRHLLAHPMVEMMPDGTARARVYWELKAVTARGNDVQGVGTYQDVLRLSDGRWRFAERVVTFDFLARRGTPWGKGRPGLAAQAGTAGGPSTAI